VLPLPQTIQAETRQKRGLLSPVRQTDGTCRQGLSRAKEKPHKGMAATSRSMRTGALRRRHTQVVKNSRLLWTRISMNDNKWQPRPDPTKKCSRCARSFEYYRIDNQINDSWYIYCAKCGSTGLLYSRNAFPQDVYEKSGYELASEAEPFLPACSCGGTFKHGAHPRCPYCGLELSRDEIVEMLDHFYSKREWSAATSEIGCLQNCLVINKRVQDLFE
jgi:DNA-directed RNA polymerase subunit RPC12/RpoP